MPVTRLNDKSFLARFQHVTGPAANTTVGEVVIIIPKIHKHLATPKSPIFDFDIVFLFGIVQSHSSKYSRMVACNFYIHCWKKETNFGRTLAFPKAKKVSGVWKTYHS